MKANISALIAANPQGLLELKPSVSIPEYRNTYGFGLKNTWTIFQSKRIHHSGEDRFEFGKKSLQELFTVQEESNGNLLVVFIVETMKNGKISCSLILSNTAWSTILNDDSQHVLQVHQMYTAFFEDHIALNMAN